MGIRGLTSFIDDHRSLLAPHRLHDIPAVIDGNNLAHRLYHDSRVSTRFGGDYDKFSRRAHDYLLAYARCGIKLHVVFDGGHDPSDRKFRTTLKRCRDRMASAQAISKGASASHRLLPILVVEVLKHVLSQLDIPIYQSDYEADALIASLANHLNCPVLSLDSDFFIFDLKGGFVPLDSVDCQVKWITEDEELGNLYCYISCQKYHVDNMLKLFPGLRRAALPLFSALAGNDFINANTFDNFLAQMHVKRKSNVKRYRGKFEAVLQWLCSNELDVAIDKVLRCVKIQERDKVKQSLQQAMDSYTDNQASMVQDILEVCKVTTAEETFPQDFQVAFRRGELPAFIMNVRNHRRVFLQVQPEMFEAPSSHMISRPFRSSLYGLLLPGGDDDLQVIEYDRVGNQLAKSFVSPTLDVPKLEELVLLESKKIRCFLCSLLGVDEHVINSFPRSLQLALAVIIFWVRNSDPAVSENHVSSALISILDLSVFSPLSRERVQDVAIPYEEMLTREEANFATSNISKFHVAPVFNRAHSYDATVVHGFSQLQSCLLYVGYLNRILCRPYPDLKHSTLFNGTLLYGFCKELSCRVDPSLYVAERLGRNSPAHIIFTSLRDLILRNVPSSCLAIGSSRKIAGGRKRRRKQSLESKVASGSSLADQIQQITLLEAFDKEIDILI